MSPKRLLVIATFAAALCAACTFGQFLALPNPLTNFVRTGTDAVPRRIGA